jgi:hypothetical protein
MPTITNYRGGSDAAIVEILGTFGPFAMLKAVPSSTEDTAEALSVTIPNLSVIKGAIVQCLDSGNNVATSDLDITWTGNVLTLAAGTTFSDITVNHAFYIFAWGVPRA